MSAERRAVAIAETIADLEYCVKIPHTVDQVIGIYAERTANTSRPMRHGMTNDEILSRLTSRPDSGGGKGGHSDPTAMAALWGEADATDDDETVNNIRAAVDLCHETATEVGELCGAPWNPPTRPGMTATVALTISRVHRWAPLVEPTASQLHGDELAHLDMLVRTALAETARWLHDKARGIWDLHHGDTLPVAVQRTIVACRVHEAWVKYPPNAMAGKDLCSRCLTFQERYRCEPTEAIVRRWEYGTDATPPGMIIEAKAAGRKTTKARRQA